MNFIRKILINFSIHPDALFLDKIESFGKFCKEPLMVSAWMHHREIYSAFLHRFVQVGFLQCIIILLYT